MWEKLKILHRQYQAQMHYVLLAIAFAFAAFGVIRPFNSGIAFMVAIAAYTIILRDVAENTRRSTTRILTRQDKLYDELREAVSTHGAQEAVLIQYSGRASSPLIQTLLRKGVKVTLFLQNPEVEMSHHQAERINGFIREVNGETKSIRSETASLSVYYYDSKASIRAALIDDSIIGFGWYTFTKPSTNAEEEVSGHDVPGIIAYGGSPEFDTLRNHFDSHFNMLRNSIDETQPVLKLEFSSVES